MTPRGDDQVAPAPGRWGVVVPVKRLDVAKSRLAVLGDDVRRALALAFAEDVVAAAVSCTAVQRVVVVTDDADAAAALAGHGAVVVPDLPDAGLNAALEHGAAVLRADALGVAALSSDLPCLQADDLADVLHRVAGRSVVADAAGTGTTLLAAPAGEPLAAAFGAQSLRRHVASGAALLEAPPGLRRDVDTPQDLADALALGAGARTTAVAASRSSREGTMQP